LAPRQELNAHVAPRRLVRRTLSIVRYATLPAAFYDAGLASAIAPSVSRLDINVSPGAVTFRR